MVPLGKRLLAVDDDIEILSIIREVAAGVGYTVEVLAESANFETTYRRVKPDAITLDIMMPDVDGIEIIRWLTAIDSSASIIIISGGGRLFMNLGEKLAQAGGSLRTKQLVKPFEVQELRKALAAACQ